MSTPADAAEHVPASGAADANPDHGNMGDIPRRLMRVKVLYTFDDQNKSNCLARLPSALSIPTVALNETTQVGVIELKTCIQAIVSASPELVAKLGHDYTVYAYDFSEYETPLVGQGLLSWILASASITPNAPAHQSQTMVTGRVCKNIMGLFSGGVKETLEVKLKLVPVPTCMQHEYVENMERYHQLSTLAPEGFDYKEWAGFLKANPAIGQLATPTPNYESLAPQQQQLDYMGGVEPLHQTLTRPSSAQDAVRNHSFYNQQNMSFNVNQTRASSPAMSTASLPLYQYPQDSRPESRASVRGESFTPQPFAQIEEGQEQQEEGPPKKRARVTQAKRPKKTNLGINNDSLRVTASTAASVRIHRPIATNAAQDLASAEQVPRAPTPRPGDQGFRPIPASSRPPALSRLRHGSVDESQPYQSPYAPYESPAAFSDNAVESPEYEEEKASPPDALLEMPSSPPVMPQHVASPVPSSPGLPTVSFPTDSGFVSDLPQDREGSDLNTVNKSCDVAAPQVSNTKPKDRAKPDRSRREWMSAEPGPMDLLPTSYVPKPKTYPRPDPKPSSELPQLARPCQSRGLPRSHTWSGADDLMSDAAEPDGSQQTRSGSGARRKHYIREKLEKAIDEGKTPDHCHNCGEIDTPTWRKAYTWVEYGQHPDIKQEDAANGIVAYEAVEPEENGEPRYRIFSTKALAPHQKVNGGYEEINLCNACGVWLKKRGCMRPQTKWDKPEQANNGVKPKRKSRSRKKKTKGDGLTSDAVVPDSDAAIPDSEPVMGGEYADPSTSLDGTADDVTHPLTRGRSNSFQSSHRGSCQFDEVTAQAALLRAIQSSPVGVRGSKGSPIEIEPDLTPKPTRRLLFPSPRKDGETKSLDERPTSHPSKDQLPAPTPTDLEACLAIDGDAEVDKENCPPPGDRADPDDLAHFLEGGVSAKSTPTKSRQTLEDLLKTPTQGSKHRTPLTPNRNAENDILKTPSRTPRTVGRAATLGPETPFTKHLNALMNGTHNSPGQQFDFSAFPSFNNTPGRSGAQFPNLPDDFLSSDLPLPSSPLDTSGLGFNLYEDPDTATAGLWSGASIFENSDAVMSDAADANVHADAGRGEVGERKTKDEETVVLKMNMNGISVDFAAMIENVCGANEEEEEEGQEGEARVTEVDDREPSSSGDKEEQMKGVETPKDASKEMDTTKEADTTRAKEPSNELESTKATTSTKSKEVSVSPALSPPLKSSTLNTQAS